MSTADLRVVAALGARSVKQTFRRPQLFAPIIVFPTLLLAIQTAGAGSAVDLPGFPPVDSFLDFMLAGAMIQATMLAGNSGGIALAVDIEMGFTDRLLAAPISRFAMVLGRLAGTAVLVELEGGATGVAPVVRALDEAGLAVESLDLVEPTLDDVFVAKTGQPLEGADEPPVEAVEAPS